MFFGSQKKHISENAIEIKISDQSNLPGLHRLSTEFGMAVLSISKSTATPKCFVLCEIDLIKNNKSSITEFSPEFTTLIELEEFVDKNFVAVVQKYLFGEQSLDKEKSFF